MITHVKEDVVYCVESHVADTAAANLHSTPEVEHHLEHHLVAQGLA